MARVRPSRAAAGRPRASSLMPQKNAMPGLAGVVPDSARRDAAASRRARPRSAPWPRRSCRPAARLRHAPRGALAGRQISANWPRTAWRLGPRPARSRTARRRDRRRRRGHGCRAGAGPGLAAICVRGRGPVQAALPPPRESATRPAAAPGRATAPTPGPGSACVLDRQRRQLRRRSATSCSVCTWARHAGQLKSAARRRPRSASGRVPPT